MSDFEKLKKAWLEEIGNKTWTELAYDIEKADAEKFERMYADPEFQKIWEDAEKFVAENPDEEPPTD